MCNINRLFIILTLLPTNTFSMLVHQGAEPTTLKALIEHAQCELLDTEPKTISERHLLVLTKLYEKELLSPLHVKDVIHAFITGPLKKMIMSDTLTRSFDDPAQEKWEHQLTNMILVQKYMEKRNYVTFFHSANSGYALFLALNKQLHEYKTGHTTPELWQYLRAPEDHTELEPERMSPRSSVDEDIKGTNLLSVSYAPTAGFFNGTEGPLYFCVNNLSFAQNFAQHIIDLFRQFGASPEPQTIRTFISKLIPQFGIYIQIFVDRSLVSRIAYSTTAFGLKKNETITDVLQNLNAELQGFVPPLQSAYKKLEPQARITLNPSIFNQPNDRIKIIVWDFFNSEENTLFNQIYHQLMEEFKANPNDYPS